MHDSIDGSIYHREVRYPPAIWLHWLLAHGEKMKNISVNIFFKSSYINIFIFKYSILRWQNSNSYYCINLNRSTLIKKILFTNCLLIINNIILLIYNTTSFILCIYYILCIYIYYSSTCVCFIVFILDLIIFWLPNNKFLVSTVEYKKKFFLYYRRYISICYVIARYK